MKKTEQIYIRDPFVLYENGKYYMYCSTGHGYGCYVSDDLENWSDTPKEIFNADETFAGYRDFWAPECHKYNGKFYLFATSRCRATEHRGVSIFCSDTPDGDFKLWSVSSDGKNSYITPTDWDAIDGTLYIENGEPYMVFVHEWTCIPGGIGSMSLVKLSDDLSHAVSEPVELFTAIDPKYIKSFYKGGNGVTDGPFLVPAAGSNKLFMIWSSFSPKGYVELVAVSESGKIAGPWTHAEKPLFEAGITTRSFSKLEGGHGMIFKNRDGNTILVLHSPNHPVDGQFEHAVFIPVDIGADGISLKV